MQIPVQIAFRGIDPSAAVEDRIHAEAAKLERYHERLTRCRVVVEKLHHRHHRGDLFHVRIDLTLPGAELVVNRDPGEHHAHEDLYVAIRDAFDAARRQVMDQARRQRHEVKSHEESPVGRVIEVWPDLDYGFLEAAEGHRVYFHRNSVVAAGFGNLEVGSKVRFIEELGEKGPQASTVIPLR